MAQKDYSGYKADDLLNDDYFIHSVRQPTPESDAFWANQNIEHKEAEWAKFIIECMQVKEEEFSDEEVDALWERIQVENTQRELKKSQKIRHLYIFLSMAASFLLMLVSVPWLFQGTGKLAENRIDMAALSVPQTNSQDIQLILSDERQMPIEGKNAEIEYDKQGTVTINTDNHSLADNNESCKANQPVFNQLIVPLGKRSKLTLSDGSEMWINAGTRVVYPTVFEPDNRTIFVDGEIYLSVVPDKSRPFIVQTNYMDVQVLGTSFDVSAYKKDGFFSVVLVSGSVVANKAGQPEYKIVPGERLAHDGQSVRISKVNTDDYTSWKDGLFHFKSENMQTIIQRLSHYYGKAVVCDEKTANLKFSGKLDLMDDLKDVLNGFGNTAPVSVREQNGAFYVHLTE
ncbi:iron dicitrate transporter FecR [Bacteroidia bacterium]|nr:iron dicitrate transporter FecR [Bacteroidia bacterium]